MGKRFRIGLAVIAVAFIGAVVWQFSRPRPDDPVYHGKHLSAWLNDIDWRIGNTNSEIASDAVHQIGMNALPMLLTMIQTKDSWGPRFSSLAWFVHRKLPFFPVLTDPGSNRRGKAMAGFAALGPVAKPAIPALSQILFKDPDNTEAEVAMSYIGKDTIPALVGGLTNSNAKVQDVVIDTLGNMSSDADYAVPALIDCLNNTNERVRIRAALSLGRFPQKSPMIMPVLLQRMNDKDYKMRQCAIVSLRRFGPAALTAVPAIQNALNDTNQMVRYAATNALEKIDPEAAIKAGVK